MVNDRTTNHNLPLPTQGSYEDTWGTDVMNNDMTDKLESKVPIRDFESNLSDYTPHDGAKFEATDTGAVYFGDGSSWNQDDTNGPNPLFTSATVEDEISFGVGADAQADLDTSTGAADDAFFFLDFIDQAGTSPAPSIRWMRHANDSVALRVRDTTNSSNLITVDDGGVCDFHNGDVENAAQMWSGAGTGSSIDFSNAQVNTGGSTWTVRDTTNAADIARFNEGTAVEILQGLTVSGGSLSVSSQIDMGGNIDMGTNSITNVSDYYTSSGSAHIYTGNFESANLFIQNRHLAETFLEFANVDTTVNAPNGLESKSNPVPFCSQGTEYDIQKNGTDGTGIINFKT